MSKFKSFSIIEHIYFGLFVWFFVFIINTLFFIARPEKTSPYTYLFASIIGLLFLIKRSPKQHYWPNIIIFVITVLLMLDESAYGTEVFNIEPLYWKKYDYYVYDLHNLIKGLFEILIVEIKRAGWTYRMFEPFIRVDLVIIGLLFLYLMIYRLRIRKIGDLNQIRQKAIDLASIFLIGFAFFYIYHLIFLPAEPKNAWLLVDSKNRIGLLIAICIYIGLMAALYFNAFNSKSSLIRGLTNIMDSTRLKRLTYFLLGLGLVLITIYPLMLPFLPSSIYKAVFLRIEPLAHLLTVSFIFFSFVLMNWDGLFNRSLSSYKNNLLYFFRRYPGYIYLGFVVTQLFISTMIDQGLLSFKFIAWNLHGNINWSLWVEESFEMIASFELAVAGVTFRYNNFSTIESFKKEKKE